nr:unnamed protein product [Callosobruchus analis]
MINILMAKIEKLTDLCTGSLAQMNLITAKAEENTKKYIDEQIANLQKSINTISRVSIPEPTEPGTSNTNKTSTLQKPQGKPVTAQRSQQKQVTKSNLFDKQRNLANYYVNLNKDIGMNQTAQKKTEQTEESKENQPRTEGFTEVVLKRRRHRRLQFGDHNKPENINYQQKQEQRKTLNNYYCIIHQNVQYLGNSVDKINLVLQEHPLCKVLCVTEHWKSEEQLQQIGIQGFKLASSFFREEGHHGGAAVYVEKNVMFQQNRNLNKISVIDNKSKAMWVICNEIRGHVPGDPYEVANKVNHYLSVLVPNITQNLDNTQYNCEIPYRETLCLRPITADSLVKLSNKLKNKYSSGADELPTSIIKTFLKEIKDILSYIVNNSLKFGIFPEQLKLSEIKPC